MAASNMPLLTTCGDRLAIAGPIGQFPGSHGPDASRVDRDDDEILCWVRRPERCRGLVAGRR